MMMSEFDDERQMMMMGGGGGGGGFGSEGEHRADRSSSTCLEKNIPNVKILEDVQKEKPARERRSRRNHEEDEGYEEISSDEDDLDELGERRNKKVIVSVLDIDFGSLQQAAKQRSAAGSEAGGGGGPVFQRFKASSVFARLGVSKALAGERLFAQVEQACQAQLQEIAEAEGRAAEGESDNVLFSIFQ